MSWQMHGNMASVQLPGGPHFDPTGWMHAVNGSNESNEEPKNKLDGSRLLENSYAAIGSLYWKFNHHRHHHHPSPLMSLVPSTLAKNDREFMVHSGTLKGREFYFLLRLLHHININPKTKFASHTPPWFLVSTHKKLQWLARYVEMNNWAIIIITALSQLSMIISPVKLLNNSYIEMVYMTKLRTSIINTTNLLFRKWSGCGLALHYHCHYQNKLTILSSPTIICLHIWCIWKINQHIDYMGLITAERSQLNCNWLAAKNNAATSR